MGKKELGVEEAMKQFGMVLFRLPSNLTKQSMIQQKFFNQSTFWAPFLGRLKLWATPFAVTKTETPDHFPALALLVDVGSDHGMLQTIVSEMANELQVPAYTIVATELDTESYASMNSLPKPWSISLH